MPLSRLCYTSCPRRSARRGSALVYSMLILAVLLVVTTALSLYVVRQQRFFSIISNSVRAYYVAEAGVERGLYLIRREGVSPEQFEEEPALAWARLSTLPSGGSAAVGVGTTTSEVIVNIGEDAVEYIDLFDATEDTLRGVGVQSVQLTWDSGPAWLEAGVVYLQLTPDAELQQPRAAILSPSQNTSFCQLHSLLELPLTNLQPRLRLRPIGGSIRNLRIRAYDSPSCGGSSKPLSGRVIVRATGEFRGARQAAEVSMPQAALPSGLFGYVLFSDTSIVKFLIGQQNLAFWPRPLDDRFEFGYQDLGVVGVSTTASLPFSFAGTAVFYPDSPDPTLRYPGAHTGPSATPTTSAPVGGTAIFTLVNTDASSSAPTGEVTLLASTGAPVGLETVVDFAANGVSLPDPTNTSTEPGLKTCDELRDVSGVLRLEEFGSVFEDRNPDGTLNAWYYDDRCAVGVRLTPNLANPLLPMLDGQLLAYADPGGTALVNLVWDPPKPQLQVEFGDVPVGNGATWDFGSIDPGTTTSTVVRLCNVGDVGTTLDVTGVNVSGASFRTVPPSPGLPRSLPPVGVTCVGVPLANVIQFTAEFAPTQVRLYTGQLAVTSTDPDITNAYIAVLRGSGSFGQPGRDGTLDCFGIGDGADAGSNVEVRCEWQVVPGAASYEVRANDQCASEFSLGGSNPNLYTTGISCVGSTCSFEYDVSGDDAASSADDRFRCHQVQAVAADGGTSGWSAVRGTTGVTSASPSGPPKFFLATGHTGDFRSGYSSWQDGANAFCQSRAATLGLSGTYRAWMCGNVAECQLLGSNQTYVWVNEADGVSFRTDSSRVPVPDFWHGWPGIVSNCSFSGNFGTNCSVRRTHVVSTTDSNLGTHLRTGIALSGTSGLSNGVNTTCMNTTGNRAWNNAVNSETSLGQFAHYESSVSIIGFGSDRWYTSGGGATRDCTDGPSNVEYGTYCYEVTGVPNVSVSTPASFCTVTVGASATQSVTVSNTGTGPLNFTSFTSSNPAFSWVSPDLTPIPPSGNRVYQVRFEPTAYGDQTTTLTVNSNDPDTPAATVQAFGVGGSASQKRILVTNQSWNGNFEAESPSRSWWESADLRCTNDSYLQRAGCNRTWRALMQVNNTTWVPGVITGGTEYVNQAYQPLFTAPANDTVANNGGYAVSSTLSGPAGETWTGDVGPQVCRVSGNPWTTNSSGEGGGVGNPAATGGGGWTTNGNRSCDLTKRVYCVEVAAVAVPNVFVSTPASFCTVTVGVSATQSVTVWNSGTGPLSLTSFTSSNPAFSWVSPDLTPIAPSSNRVYQVRFEPTAYGDQATTLTVNSNDPDTPAATALAHGAGGTPNDKRIVVTVGTWNGNFEGSSGPPRWWEVANQRCQADTSVIYNGCGSTWRALMWGRDSSGVVRIPQSVITNGTRYVNASYEELFTATADNVTPGSLLHVVSSTIGAPAARWSTWTGYGGGGQSCEQNVAPPYDDDWFTTSGSIAGIIGHPNYTNSWWRDIGAYYCGANVQRIFCVEQ